VNRVSLRHLVAGGCSALLLGGCSTISDWVSSPEVEPPAELTEITEQVRARTLWNRDIGAGAAAQDLRLAPLHHQGRLYAASADGRVTALNAADGSVAWSVELDVPASGGPGVGEELVLIGTSDAEVIALARADGAQRWRAGVSSEVLATPVAAFGRVVVRTIDGKVIGLDAASGEQKWIYERDIPVLTLRGTSSPVIRGSGVLCGMAGGKLVALDISSGEVLWDATVTVPSGRSELERLADIDGDPLPADGVVYVATYQGEVAALGEGSGSLLWRRKFSSYSGMAADRYNVYAADAEGVVWALNADNGSALWRQEALRNRELSDVAVLGEVVAVGDLEGYVHFLSSQDGSLVGRTRVGNAPIRNGLLVVDATLYVQGGDGELEALSLQNIP